MKRISIWIILDIIFSIGLFAGTISATEPVPPPAVAISVQVSAQLAIEEEAPVLPDDFASNDMPRVSANWIPGDPSSSVNPADTTIPEVKIVSRRRNRAELEKWIKEKYTKDTPLIHGVMSHNQENLVLIHLVNEHKFKPDQVNGMAMWLALALHDAAHGGLIRGDELIMVEQSTVQKSSAGKARGSGIKLFTSDGSWHCGPCVTQENYLKQSPPSFDFETFGVPRDGPSPSGSTPCWQGADGSIFIGPMNAAKLEAWAKLHGKQADPEKTQAIEAVSNSSEKPVTTVEVDASSSSAVLLALIEHVNRSEVAHKSNASDISTPKAGPAVRGWLPEIDVDLDDPMLKILDAMLSKDGYQLGGMKVSWPAGKRAIVFDPPVDVAYRKVLEISSKVKSIEVNGREVVIRLDGRLIQDLKVRLK